MALWIIALCEIIRLIQNTIQLIMFKEDKKIKDNAYDEFIKSMSVTDKEFVQTLAKAIERDESD